MNDFNYQETHLPSPY